MTRAVPHLIAALACVLLLTAVVRDAHAEESGTAKVCGNGVACRCNATVRGTAKLEADIVDCGRVGLRMTSGAVLDCGGHEIRGKGGDQSVHGIRLDDVSDATIRNCKVSGFQHGIRLR